MLNYSTKRIEYLYNSEDTWLKKILKKIFFSKKPYVQKYFKAADIRFKKTSIEQIEWDKCKKDIVYFAENYFYFFNYGTSEVELIKLRKYQKIILESYVTQSTIVCNARQMGISTLNRIYTLWLFLFYTRYIQLINEPTESHYTNIEAIKLAYIKLPYYMQKGIRNFNKNEIIGDDYARITNHRLKKELSNDEIKFYTLISDNTSHLHHADLVELEKKLKLGAKTIITATPNGYNAYYKLWDNANNKNNYKLTPIKLPWFFNTEHDKEWAEKMINIIGIDSFNQECNIKFINKSK